MKIRDVILLEAKPSGLGQGMLDKLFAVFSKRDINDSELGQKFEDGLQIAEYLFKFVGPKNLIWVAKQYTTDEYFFLHDLDEWKNTFDEFDKLCKDRRITIEKDVNKYKSITELRKTIDELGGRQAELGSKFFSKAVGGLEPFFNNGDADLLYRGSKYIIYHPISFDSSSVLNTGNLIGSVNLCTVMSSGYFEQYSDLGYLIYIISQDRMYNCYINTSAAKESEFADQQNDHSKDLSFLLDEFPELRDFIRGRITGETSVVVVGEILTPNEIRDGIKEHGAWLAVVDDRDYTLCLDALTNSPTAGVLALIPPEFWMKKEMHKIISSLLFNNQLESWQVISYAPEPIQVQMIQKDPSVYSFIDKPSELVTDAFIRHTKVNTHADYSRLINLAKHLTPKTAYTLVTTHGKLSILSSYRPDLVTPKIEIAAIDYIYKRYPNSLLSGGIDGHGLDIKSPQAKKHLAIRQGEQIVNHINSGGKTSDIVGIDKDTFDIIFNNYVTELHVNSRDVQRRSWISSNFDIFINLCIQYLTSKQVDTLKKLASEKTLVVDKMPNNKNLIVPDAPVDPALIATLRQMRQMRQQPKSPGDDDNELNRVKELAERLNR